MIGMHLVPGNFAPGSGPDGNSVVPVGETRVESMVGYYIDTRLRAEPEERLRYCDADG